MDRTTLPQPRAGLENVILAKRDLVCGGAGGGISAPPLALSGEFEQTETVHSPSIDGQNPEIVHLEENIHIIFGHKSPIVLEMAVERKRATKQRGMPIAVVGHVVMCELEGWSGMPGHLGLGVAVGDPSAVKVQTSLRDSKLSLEMDEIHRAIFDGKVAGSICLHVSLEGQMGRVAALGDSSLSYHQTFTVVLISRAVML